MNDAASRVAATPGPHLLSGVRVLDLGVSPAASASASLMADWGADVVKVEPPEGDRARSIHALADGASLLWAVEGRNKRSIVLDLAQPGDVGSLLDLVAAADVVVENFGAGRLESLGLGYAAMRERNPGIVLLRVSAFGQTGPNRHRSAHDHVALAAGGLMGITGFSDRAPIPTGTTTSDYQAAILGAFAVLMALYRRDRSDGLGDEIDLAQTESVLRFTEVLVPACDRMGVVRGRYGNTHFAAAPGEHFRTRDGRYLIMTISANGPFERLCTVLGREDWKRDPRFVSHQSRWQHVHELNAVIAEWVAGQPVEQLIRTLDEAKLAYAFIQDISEIARDPQYLARESIATLDDPALGPVRMPAVFPKFSSTPEQSLRAAPALNEHAAAVRADWLGSAA